MFLGGTSCSHLVSELIERGEGQLEEQGVGPIISIRGVISLGSWPLETLAVQCRAPLEWDWLPQELCFGDP